MSNSSFFRRTNKVARPPLVDSPLLPETENRHSDRYKIIPALAETDHLSLEWYPYIMRRSTPQHRSPTLNTDEFGFRRCKYGDKLIGFEDILTHAGPIGLLSGNSTAFGIGASSDSYIIPSILNGSDSNTVWYNLAHRASNLTQERINLDLYAPPNTQYVVLLSGANNLILTLLDGNGDRFRPPFVGEQKFRTLNPSTNNPALPFEERFKLMMEVMARDFMLLGQNAKSNGLRCLFILQPLAAWCSRTFCREEVELIEIWDAHSSLLHSVHAPESLNPWREAFVSRIQILCQLNGVDFIDLNTCEKFLSGKWVFADRVHLADEGNKIVAEIINNWARIVESDIKLNQ